MHMPLYRGGKGISMHLCRVLLTKWNTQRPSYVWREVPIGPSKEGGRLRCVAGLIARNWPHRIIHTYLDSSESEV